MEKMKFSISINAPKEKVWQTLWNDASYRKWTSAFMEGSHAVTDNWKEGSKVLFMDPKGNGMVSTVAANKPNEFMSFKHLGEVKNGVEDTSSDKIKGWAGAMENYTLKGTNGKTELLVEMDITEDFKDYFVKTWPKALDLLKESAEAAPEIITIQALVNAPVEKVWAYWSEPEHIMKWNNASDDWHTTSATNDLRVGGQFSSRMEARNGSFGFDFGGVYDEVKTNELIAYTIGDGRKVKVNFTKEGNATKVVESFEAEGTHSIDMQRGGWQNILDNFKKYTEAN
ncbi:MAG TPA: SRPBCC domain-containing protein [Chitinophagaceae bacterium]|nr:SRPBCC domain-containing protein [Chitinophagaceae bacterium]